MPDCGEILLKARMIINGERQNQYGDPEDSFAQIARYWTAFLSTKPIDESISAHDVAMMLILMKVARCKGQEYKEDNYIDAAGYIALANDMVRNK